LDIVKALHARASELKGELSKIHQAIRALNGTTRQGVPRSGGRKTYTHTAATRRKLSIKMKRMWAEKQRKAAK
jgi:hypothetical protein